MLSLREFPRHLIALALGTLALGIAEFSMMSILSAVAADLGVSIPKAGHFISAYASGVCAGVILMVVALRGIPLKRLLLGLAAVIFAGSTFTAFAVNYPMMIIGRFISGLPHGIYFGVGAIVTAQLAKPGMASRDVCLMAIGMTVANLIGVPLGSFLSWAVSWRAAFALVAFFAFVLFFAIRAWVPNLPALPDKGFLAQFRFLGSLSPWLVLGAIALGNGGFFAYYSYVNPVMEDVAGLPASSMSAIIALAGFGMVAGNLISARVAGHISDPAIACIGQGVLCAALGALFLTAHWSLPAIILTAVAAGCVFFMSGPEQIMVFAEAGDGKLLGAALGQVAFNGGNAIGAYIGGLPIAAGKSAEWAAIPGSISAMTGFALLYIVWRIHDIRRRERLEAKNAPDDDED
jgi:DHA1 family arabinose polymer transporter-like MFS transporter